MTERQRLIEHIEELRRCFREFQEYKIQYDEAIENAAEAVNVPKAVLKKVVTALEKRKTMVLRSEADQVSELITELMQDD